MDDTIAETIKALSAAIVWYRTAAKKDHGNRILDRTKIILTKKRLKAVPIDESNGFCNVKELDYFDKLQEVLSGPQFTSVTKDETLFLKTEETFNEEIQVLDIPTKMTKAYTRDLKAVELSQQDFTG